MAKYLGNDLILLVEDTPSSGTFTKVAATSDHTLTINNERIDVSDKDSNRWQEFLPAGNRSATISMTGFITDDATYELIYQAVVSDTILNYQLQYGNGKVIEGAFHIESKDITGPRNNAQAYTVSLANSGAPTFT